MFLERTMYADSKIKNLIQDCLWQAQACFYRIYHVDSGTILLSVYFYNTCVQCVQYLTWVGMFHPRGSINSVTSDGRWQMAFFFHLPRKMKLWAGKSTKIA